MLKKRDYNNAVAADMAVQPAAHFSAQEGTVLSSQFIFVLPTGSIAFWINLFDLVIDHNMPYLKSWNAPND